MTDATASACVELFRKATGLDSSERGAKMTDDEILSTAIDDFNLDSLETMEFIMAVEDRFDIELDEEAVNRCKNVSDLVVLVNATRV